MRMSFWCIINFLIFLICLCESALTPEVKKVYGGLLSGKGLYNEDDGITLFNAENLKSIYGTNNSWLLEFYNSWCGHCHVFAPVWKTVAANVQEWKDVVKLAAIDCSVDENTPTCRDYNIMGYPTVKFFSAHSSLSNLGTELKVTHSASDITKDLVGILQKEQLEGRGNNWPNLIPYKHFDLANLWKNTDTTYVFLIFVRENDPLATELILDLSGVKNISIRGVLADNESLSKLLGVRTYPSVCVFEKPSQKQQFLRPEEPTRESYRLKIKDFLKDRGYAVPNEPKDVIVLKELPNVLELQDAREAIVRLEKIKELGDVMFLVDLENTIRYNLEHEISIKRNISGEALEAVKNFLKVVAKYFPLSKSGIEYMEKLRDLVLAENQMTGSKFRTYLNSISAGGLDSILSKKEPWIGCAGSEVYFRGFPCGMWTMFHYFTVNALSDPDCNEDCNPLEVLEAMQGYVKHFFGCTDCSKHFVQMVKSRKMNSRVTNREEAVLWLWAAHNEVNERLSKTSTEDPYFPKIQFPSSQRCPYCKDKEGNWDHEGVLKYLKNMGSRYNLNKMGSNTTLYNPREVRKDDENLSKSEAFKDESMQKIGKDFNIFDISLCVVLYVVSAMICVGVCLKFVLKKRHGRKSHGQDLYGKV